MCNIDVAALVSGSKLRHCPLSDFTAVLTLQKTKLESQTTLHHQTKVQHQVPRYIEPLKLDEVQPPDHVEGLRVEQDGHLNHDYKKEIIIGNHEEFEQPGSDKKLVARLKIIFLK